jgi:hypothetical protein
MLTPCQICGGTSKIRRYGTRTLVACPACKGEPWREDWAFAGEPHSPLLVGSRADIIGLDALDAQEIEPDLSLDDPEANP